jgi:hypothetical protein
MTFESYRVDFMPAGETENPEIEYFDGNREKALRRARAISRRRDEHGFPIMAYLIRAVGDNTVGPFEDTGQIVYCEGRIVERDGIAA